MNTPILDRTDTSNRTPASGDGAGSAPPAGVESRSRRLLWGSLAGLLILGILAFVLWRTFTLEHKPVRRGRGLGTQPVGVTAIKTGDIRLIVDALGTVTPLATVTVQSQISGMLTKVGFKEGQLVHTGDFLAQIDPRPYEVSLQQYQGQLARDQAALKQAQMDLARYETLQHQDAIVRQTYEDQVWQVKQDQGTVVLDQAQVKAQQLNLTYCHITSPVNGRVGLRLVDPGNYVQSSSSSGLVVITQLDPISVIFTVPEDQVPDIVSRYQSNATLTATAYDRANTTQLASGKLGAFDTEVDTTTGTVKMRATFDNGANKLFPFQFVNIRLVLDTLHDVVRAPVAAVQHGAPGDFVYIVNEDKTVSVRKVELGAQDGDFLAVKSGLSVGERVVVDGVDQLKDGSHVTIQDESGGAAAGEGTTPRRHRNGQPGQGNGQGQGQGQHRRRPPQSQQSSDGASSSP